MVSKVYVLPKSENPGLPFSEFDLQPILEKPDPVEEVSSVIVLVRVDNMIVDLMKETLQSSIFGV